MTHRIIASLLDVLLAAALAFAGFRIGQALAPCSNPANCFLQIPLSLGGALILVALYFALGYRVWGETPGERAARGGAQGK
jgi:hypothetical protein